MEKSAIAECLKQIAARTVRAIEDDDEAGNVARIFTRHITEVTDTVRAHLRTTAAADSAAAQSEAVLWLPGWDRESKAPLWFRADAVDNHTLHDFEGRANGISYNAKEGDARRRSAWASAEDFRGDREYEVINADDVIHDKSGPQPFAIVDRSKAVTMPAPWYVPGKQTVQIAVHAAADRFGLKIPVGIDRNGDPVERRICSDGTAFGIHVSHNPEFRRLLEENPGSNVAFGPSCGPAQHGATSGQHAADAMVANGVDRRMYAATGETVYAHSYGPDGTRVWEDRPETSTLAVTEGRDADGNPVPGSYVELRTPWSEQ